MPVTGDHDSQDKDIDQIHYHEISAAMNAVVRACADNVRDDRRNRGAWSPAGTTDRTPPTASLLASARRDILDKLQLVIRCAETAIREMEHGPTRTRSHPPW